MTFVIAEAGSNWVGGGLQRAYELIDRAADAGVDAVKFQMFRSDSTYADGAGVCRHLKAKGIDRPIRELFSQLELPTQMVGKLATRCEQQSVAFMASAFSTTDFAAIDPFVRAHKVASPELHHPQLLRLCRESGKPIFLSTGLSTTDDIRWALSFLQGANVTLMQCTVQYPTEPAAVHVATLTELNKIFNLPVGLSDHSRNPIIAPVMAVALGATVIEKHFTLSNDLVGPDHSWAITCEELSAMVAAIREAEKMRGDGKKSVADQELELLHFSRRSVHTTCEVAVGETLRLGVNIAILRPGNQPAGVHPKYLSDLEGKRASRRLHPGVGIQQGDWT